MDKHDKEIFKNAKRGDPEAICRVASWYSIGWAVKENKAKAFKLYDNSYAGVSLG